MTFDLVKSAVDVVKLIPRYAAPLAVCLGAVLLLPADVLQLVGIGQIAEDHRTAMGLVFVFCCCVLVFSGFGALQVVVKTWWYRFKAKRKIAHRLARLNEDEKQILRFYVQYQTRTNRLRVDDGVVQGLVSARIIFLATELGSLLDGFDHNISQVAWDVLNKDPSLLEGTTNTYRTDKRDRGY